MEPLFVCVCLCFFHSCVFCIRTAITCCSQFSEYLFGTGELGNSGDEGFLHSLEVNEMKGVSSPLSSAVAIMPSPIVMWRFKVLLNLT